MFKLILFNMILLFSIPRLALADQVDIKKLLRTIDPVFALELLKQLNDLPKPIVDPANPVFVMVQYDNYERVRQQNLLMFTPLGAVNEVDLLDNAYDLSHELSRRAKAPQGYSLYGTIKNINGIYVPFAVVPDEFKQTLIHFLIFLHESEHVIQYNRLIWSVEQLPTNIDDIVNSDDYKITLEESPILAEWVFLNSLPDEVIDFARNLVLSYAWTSSQGDQLTKSALLRTLKAKQYPDPKDFLDQERFPGRRLYSSAPKEHLQGLSLSCQTFLKQ